MPFQTPIATTRIGPNLWELLEDLVYEGKWGTFTAEGPRNGRRGFRTDYASTLWWASWVIARTGATDPEAVIHDLFCVDLRRYWNEVRAGVPNPEPPLVSARDADRIFALRMCREADEEARARGDRSGRIGPIKRAILFAAVRWGALANPARRTGWWRDAPTVLGISAAVLAATIGVLLVVHVAVGWVLSLL